MLSTKKAATKTVQTLITVVSQLPQDTLLKAASGIIGFAGEQIIHSYSQLSGTNSDYNTSTDTHS